MGFLSKFPQFPKKGFYCCERVLHRVNGYREVVDGGLAESELISACWCSSMFQQGSQVLHCHFAKLRQHLPQFECKAY